MATTNYGWPGALQPSGGWPGGIQPQDAVTATGTPALDTLTTAGTGTHTAPTYTGSGAPSLSTLTTAGTGTFTAPTYTGTGTPTVQEITCAGTGSHSVHGTGALTLDALTCGTASGGPGGMFVPLGGLALGPILHRTGGGGQHRRRSTGKPGL